MTSISTLSRALRDDEQGNAAKREVLRGLESLKGVIEPVQGRGASEYHVAIDRATTLFLTLAQGVTELSRGEWHEMRAVISGALPQPSRAVDMALDPIAFQAHQAHFACR